MNPVVQLSVFEDTFLYLPYLLTNKALMPKGQLLVLRPRSENSES